MNLMIRRSPAPSPEDAINIVANNEAKGLTYLHLTQNGPNTRHEVGKGIAERYGVTEAIYVGHYCKMFVKFDFARSYEAESRYNSRLVTYSEAQNSDIAIPAIGAFLGWSLEYEPPLDDMLSTSASRSTRGPINSIITFAELIDSETPSRFRHSGYGNDNPLNSRLKSLISSGIVVKTPAESSFIIDDPTYTGDIPFERLRRYSSLAYEALQAAKEIRPDGEWTISEIIAIARIIEPGFFENEENKAKLRKRLIYAASTKHPKDLKGAIHKIDLDTKSYHFFINPEYQDAVANLVERTTKLLLEDKVFMAASRNTAIDLYADTEASRQLLIRGLAPRRPEMLEDS